MAYEAKITAVKAGKVGLYGILAVVLNMIAAYLPMLSAMLASIPAELMTAEVVCVIAVITAIENYLKHRDD